MRSLVFVAVIAVGCQNESKLDLDSRSTEPTREDAVLRDRFNKSARVDNGMIRLSVVELDASCRSATDEGCGHTHQQTAYRWLAAFQRVVDRSWGGKLAVLRETSTPSGTALVLQQQFDGLPVERGSTTIFARSDGHVVIDSRLVVNAPASDALMSETDARRSLQKVGGLVAVLSLTAVIEPPLWPTERPRRAYKARLAFSDHSTATVVIDGASGRILSQNREVLQ
jgi:hypothetical protein